MRIAELISKSKHPVQLLVESQPHLSRLKAILASRYKCKSPLLTRVFSLYCFRFKFVFLVFVSVLTTQWDSNCHCLLEMSRPVGSFKYNIFSFIVFVITSARSHSCNINATSYFFLRHLRLRYDVTILAGNLWRSNFFWIWSGFCQSDAIPTRLCQSGPIRARFCQSDPIRSGPGFVNTLLNLSIPG